MKENYLSKKQQGEMLSKERHENKIFILYDGSVVSGNPYKGNSQEALNCVDERKRFLRETGRL